MTGVYAEQICEKNKYVAKCGSVTIGTNLLKGFPLSNTSGHSHNYYDYSGKNNIVNLRNFFGGIADLRYTTYDGYTTTETSSDYIDARDNFLNTICNPVGQSTNFFTCLPCSDGGKVAKSTVTLNSDDEPTDWEFHTFADCFKNEFSDSTGVYKYVNNGNDTNCYYSIEIAGDTLVSESWGGIVTQNTPSVD